MKDRITDKRSNFDTGLDKYPTKQVDVKYQYPIKQSAIVNKFLDAVKIQYKLTGFTKPKQRKLKFCHLMSLQKKISMYYSKCGFHETVGV